jgi:hypothetical protein
MVVETFGSKARRTLHVACVKDLEDAGWIAYYLPLQLSRLMDRARLVSKRTLMTGEDPTFSDVLNLAHVLRKV